MKDCISKFLKAAQVQGPPYVFVLFSSIKDKKKGENMWKTLYIAQLLCKWQIILTIWKQLLFEILELNQIGNLNK